MPRETPPSLPRRPSSVLVTRLWMKNIWAIIMDGITIVALEEAACATPSPCFGTPLLGRGIIVVILVSGASHDAPEP